MTTHRLTTTLTTWECSCGSYGVFITAAERDHMQFCPKSPEAKRERSDR